MQMVEWKINPKEFKIKYKIKDVDITAFDDSHPFCQILKKKKSVLFKRLILETPILEINFEDEASCDLFYVWFEGHSYKEMVKILKEMIINYFEKKYIMPLKGDVKC